jgi:phage-related protein
MEELKDISWEGSSLEDLKKFPPDARSGMGYQLHLVQSGEMPDDWKALGNLGKGITGVYEIRLSVEKNVFRTAYVAKFDECVVVLHCWQKKTQTTSDSDKAIIVKRYRDAKEYFDG